MKMSPDRAIMPVHNNAKLRARRQNHSCDQCRKSKRACDARHTDGQRPAPPCSYCTRTKKRCTTEWAQSQAQLKRGSEDFLFPWATWTPPSASDQQHQENGVGCGIWDDLIQEVMAWDPADVQLSSGSWGDSEAQTQTETSSDALTLSDLFPDFCSTSDLDLDVCHNQTWPGFSPPQSILPESPRRQPRRPSDPPPVWMTPRTSLSPFSIDQQMMATSNSHLTSANLLQIYHDVVEHNLSCWLTEMTCPYQPASTTATTTTTAAQVAPPPEWGSSWSNRIYQRTIKIDRVAQSCRLVQLTRAEDQAASKALNLAIMAFATQWAQGSSRHREKYPTSRSVEHAEDEFTDEFDRVIQNHFWDQAQRALQQVADLESYRVVCAELIFGLTQRPWNSGRASSGSSPKEATDSRGFGTDLVLSEVRDIINKDGPPKHMESAARKMHALKYRCDAMEKGLGAGHKGKSHNMNYEDRATIGLLYWLAIMFDTVSSSMNERPVVVLDEDCQHESAQKEPQHQHAALANRWNLDLFVQGGLEETHQTHWPCSYETAAEDVTKSAPVKVLLFRHLSYLQNAIRKGLPEEQIEEIIHSTNSLYEYWNKTHGAFFRELVQDYSAVPQRIQGWFVCISAHWHLAVLMLADLLEFADENVLSGGSPSQMAQTYRKQSISELADLARVATPPARDVILGVPQMPNFHHAVNQGTLLTEPWTIILIRAFTKACVIFLGEVEALRGATVYSSHDVDRNMEQAEDCIKGLWLLGKKSDMAREIAEALSRALDSQQYRGTSY